MAAEPGRTPSPPTWCDGTPHHPQAIPPLPFHDLRWDGDNPATRCARCGEVCDAISGLVIAPARVSPEPTQ